MDTVLQRFVAVVAQSAAAGRVEELYLFGSRCREDWRPDSDYDVLAVVDRRDQALTEALYGAVVDVLLETGRLVSLKIYPRQEFERLKAIPTPFMQRIMQEGKRLGYPN